MFPLCLLSWCISPSALGRRAMPCWQRTRCLCCDLCWSSCRHPHGLGCCHMLLLCVDVGWWGEEILSSVRPYKPLISAHYLLGAPLVSSTCHTMIQLCLLLWLFAQQMCSNIVICVKLFYIDGWILMLPIVFKNTKMLVKEMKYSA